MGFLSSLAFIFCQSTKIVFQVEQRRKRGGGGGGVGGGFMIVFKNRCSYFNIGNNFVSVCSQS